MSSAARPVVAGVDVRDQTAPFPSPVAARPPRDAPNVLVVLLDDMGFGAPSPFGGPCEMPTADRMASNGLAYSRFHVTALCSPTRQALLTGRNHHAVGMGTVTNIATSAPGYTGVRPESAATMARILQGNGYSTAAFGKWHQTPPWEVSPSGPFDRWPTREGFDRFYGFMGGETNHWQPQLFDGTTPVTPDRGPDEGYHLSEDLADQAIDWVTVQQALTPDKPFFLYLAFGATHAPFHVAPEWRAKYRGRFDHGWDRQRGITLERQKALGVIPQDAQLAPWAPGVPRWDELGAKERRVATGLMEAYAGFAEHADVQLGRVVEALERLAVLDDTLTVYVLGDNGASAEGGLGGTLNAQQRYNGVSQDTAALARDIDSVGSPSTFPLYPVGWALAMNTPYQWTKQVASHYGATRTGMIAHWPKGIARSGELRHQWHHVIDVLPTVLEATGIPAPSSVDGVDQMPIHGVSMAYSFDAPDAADRRTTQYFESGGNRGIYHEGWAAVTKHRTPWEVGAEAALTSFDDDVWELYDTRADWTQAVDLAAERPDKLRALQQLFLIEAAKYEVFPLDDRFLDRLNPQIAGRPDLFGDRRSVTLRPGMRFLAEDAVPNVKNRSHKVTAAIEVDASGAAGLIVSQGGQFGGWALGCVDGHLTYAYNYLGIRSYAATSAAPLSAGSHEVLAAVTYDGGGLGRGACVELSVDGAVVVVSRIDETIPYSFSTHETLDVGVHVGTPVSADMAASFTGGIEFVRIDLAPQREGGGDETEETALRRSMAGQ